MPDALRVALMPDELLEPSDTPSSGVLAPLLSDAKELTAAYRKRKTPFVFESVHPADVETKRGQGWEIQRRGQRKTRMRKAKSHDRLLEDRVWCFLYRLGYPALNGERFNIGFEREDGTKGKKQIDVFAIDEETAFVIECKSKLDRGRKSLQKDVHESIALQDFIRKSIFDSFKNRPKPKIIWAYATNNIIWSEPDIERASAGKISIITENEIQYLEAFIKHMGPAGKYQVLGEFLKGQKVPGIGEVRVPAIRGKIGGEVFYSFVATPRRLLKIAFINHQALSHPDGRPAYQRMISSSRIKDIGKFINIGGYFPTNILVNFINKPKFSMITNKLNTDPNIKFGWLTLPTTYRSAWIIDGQHRLYGYSHLTGKFLDQSLFVVAFEEMQTRKEADLFITINHKQKSVPKSLLVSLLADLRLGDPEPRTALAALASAVVRAVNVDKSSPFFRRFAVHGIPPEPNQNLTISEAVNGLTRSGLFGRVVHKVLAPGPLTGATDEDTIERARKVLNGYFEMLRDAHPDRWEAGKSAYICTNPAIRAHLMLVAEIIQYLELKKGIDFIQLKEEQFVKQVGKIGRPILDFIRTASNEKIRDNFSRKFGEGGVREYLYNLCEIIIGDYEEFGSEEFRQYISQKGSDRVVEANQLVIHVAELMINHVIDVLKAVHGTHTLSSGEQAFWELGIKGQRAKDNAYKKQQDDPPGERLPKEAYLDILDLKDIIQQPDNWSHFEAVFNNAATGEKKGKKYYTSWIAHFNELRRIPAHKSALRTYSEEDFEFLDWLRSEALRKLEAAVASDG